MVMCNDCDWRSPTTAEEAERHTMTQAFSPSQYGVQHAKDTGHTWRVADEGEK